MLPGVSMGLSGKLQEVVKPGQKIIIIVFAGGRIFFEPFDRTRLAVFHIYVMLS